MMENFNRNYVSTLDGMEDKITSTRRDGNSTRLVDNAIQIIFSGDICVVKDHVNGGEHIESNKLLFDRILRRIMVEHQFIDRTQLYASKNRLEIGLRELPGKTE